MKPVSKVRQAIKDYAVMSDRPFSIKHIAMITGYSYPAVSRGINRLIEEGFIKRLNSGTGANAYIVDKEQLSSKMEIALEKAWKLIQQGCNVAEKISRELKLKEKDIQVILNALEKRGRIQSVYTSGSEILIVKVKGAAVEIPDNYEEILERFTDGQGHTGTGRVAL
jgi:DNA-binding transcriptional regulator GbsR (MarR family)